MPKVLVLISKVVLQAEEMILICDIEICFLKEIYSIRIKYLLRRVCHVIIFMLNVKTPFTVCVYYLNLFYDYLRHIPIVEILNVKKCISLADNIPNIFDCSFANLLEFNLWNSFSKM